MLLRKARLGQKVTVIEPGSGLGTGHVRDVNTAHGTLTVQFRHETCTVPASYCWPYYGRKAKDLRYRYSMSLRRMS